MCYNGLTMSQQKNRLKNYIFIFLALINSNNIFSQSSALADEFLSSLPKSLQSGLLDAEASSFEDEKDATYNQRPDTRITKIEEGIAEIRKDLLSIESQIFRDGEYTDELVRFGNSFFSSYQSSFAPINEANFASDYVLDVDDQLYVELYGKENKRHKLKILRDGSLNIPRVGNINIAGLPYQEAIKKVKDFAETRLLGTEIYVGLNKMRDMNVLLIGGAYSPGMYKIPGGSNILSLIHAAGGINSNGSFRKILHKRRNVILQEVDLYEILIKGNISLTKPLRSGDVIVIEPSQKQISISGGINQPAIYELKDNENFEDLISFAKGFASSATNSIEIYKPSGEIISIELGEQGNLNLSNGDSVIVNQFTPMPQKTFTVTLSGAIKSPGEYSFAPGTKLSEIIKKAGGYKDQAYEFGGKLFRKNVAALEKEVMEKSYKELITYMASSGGSGLSPATPLASNLEIILTELKNNNPKGRVATEFSLENISRNAALDITLDDGDLIEIPYFQSEVHIFGQVQNSGARAYVPENTFEDYIASSGGLSRFAAKDKIIVIKPNGDAYLASNSPRFFSEKEQIYPGSIIYVPREIGKIDGINFAATIAPIVSSLALSLASLNSIN